jgi:replicative DNA helicase
MSDSVSFKVSEELQESIRKSEKQLAYYCITDINKLKDIFSDRKDVNSRIFDKNIKKVLDIVLEYYENHNSLLSSKEFENTIDKLSSEDKITELEHRLIKSAYDECYVQNLDKTMFNRVFNEWHNKSSIPKINETILSFNKKYLMEEKALDFIDKTIESLKRINITRKTTKTLDISDLMEDQENQFKDLDQRVEGGHKAIMTGIKKIDDLFCGFEPGTLTVISAVTGGGKSTFGMNLTRNIFEFYNKNVLVISLEMNKQQWYRKYNSMDLYYRGFFVPYLSILKGDKDILTEEKVSELKSKITERNEHLKKRESRYKVVEGRARKFTFEEIVEAFHNRLPTFRPDFILIDQISLLELEKGDDPRHVKLGNLTKQIRAYGQDSNIPIALVVQAGRSAVQKIKGKREVEIEFENMEGSNEIGQDADNILALSSPDINKIRVSIIKQRDGGKQKVDIKGAFDYCAIYDEEERSVNAYVDSKGNLLESDDDYDTGFNSVISDFIDGEFDPKIKEENSIIDILDDPEDDEKKKDKIKSLLEEENYYDSIEEKESISGIKVLFNINLKNKNMEKEIKDFYLKGHSK